MKSVWQTVWQIKFISSCETKFSIIALREFLLDIDCLEELQPWSRKFNLFDVLKVSRNEIRHSNVLAWLLNPNENHGLGDSYIRKFVQNLTLNSKHHSNIFDLL